MLSHRATITVSAIFLLFTALEPLLVPSVYAESHDSEHSDCTSSPQLVRTLSLDSMSLAYDPINHLMYVATTSGLLVAFDSSDHIVTSISVSDSVLTSVIYDQANQALYVTGPNLAEFFPQSGRIINNLFLGASSPLYDPANKAVYFRSSNANIIAMDSFTNRVVANISIDAYPELYNPFNKEVYAVAFGGYLLAIDSSTNKVVATINVAAFGGYGGMMYDPANREMYVAGRDSVAVIDSRSNTLEERIPVGQTPAGLTYDPANKYVYVANLFSNTVTVIDSFNDKIVRTIGTGPYPLGFAYNPSDRNMYLVWGTEGQSGYGFVSVIDSETNSITSTVSGVQITFSILAFNPANGEMYLLTPGLDRGGFGYMYIISSGCQLGPEA